MSLIIKQFLGNAHIANCYIIYDKEESNSCIIIDPGNVDIQFYIYLMEEEGLTPEYIFLTHRHFDHCAGINALRVMYPKIILICSKVCSQAIQDARLNCSMFFNKQNVFVVKPAELLCDSIGILRWNRYNIEFHSTPGHTSDSTSIIVEKNVFTGDALLKEEVTITKLPSGNKQQQVQTELFLKSLHHMIAWPGHGQNFVID